MIKGILFDFDGTIADTLPICVDAFRQTVEPVVGHKMTLTDVESYFGPNEEGIFQKHFPERSQELLDIFYHNYQAMHDFRFKMAEGIVETIAALKNGGFRVALVTAKGAGSCKISLNYYKIADLFEQIEVGSPNGRVKADSITKVLNDLGLRPDEAIYVGDSPKDVISARKAGTKAWGAAWFDSAKPEEILANKPDAIFYSVEEMNRAIERELGLHIG